MVTLPPWSGKAANTLCCLSTPDQHYALCHDIHCLQWREGPGEVGHILLGQVRAHWTERRAYLIDCGQAGEGFLPEKRTTSVLRLGQYIIVQVTRAGDHQKRRQLSMQIRLHGQALSWQPQAMTGQHHYAPTLSSQQREQYAAWGHKRHHRAGALHWRTAAPLFDEHTYQSEITAQYDLWDRIENAAREQRLGHLYPTDPVRMAWQTLPWHTIEAIHYHPVVAHTVAQYVSSGQLAIPQRCQIHTLNMSTLSTYLTSLSFFATNIVQSPQGWRLQMQLTAVGPCIDIDSGYARQQWRAINDEIVPYLTQMISLQELEGALIIDVLDMPHRQDRANWQERFQRYSTQLPKPIRHMQWYGDWVRCFCDRQENSAWHHHCDQCQQGSIRLPTQACHLQDCLSILQQSQGMDYGYLQLQPALFSFWDAIVMPMLSDKKRKTITYHKANSAQASPFVLSAQTKQEYMKHRFS